MFPPPVHPSCACDHAPSWGDSVCRRTSQGRGRTGSYGGSRPGTGMTAGHCTQKGTGQSRREGPRTRYIWNKIIVNLHGFPYMGMPPDILGLSINDVLLLGIS